MTSNKRNSGSVYKNKLRLKMIISIMKCTSVNYQILPRVRFQQFIHNIFSHWKHLCHTKSMYVDYDDE